MIIEIITGYTIRMKGPDRQHDVSVGVPIALIMEHKVSAHPSSYKIVLDVGTDKVLAVPLWTVPQEG